MPVCSKRPPKNTVSYSVNGTPNVSPAPAVFSEKSPRLVSDGLVVR